VSSAKVDSSCQSVITTRASLATVNDLADDIGWVRVEMRTEQLDWVPALLAALGRPFIVEQPYARRELVGALADQLTAAAKPNLQEKTTQLERIPRHDAL
jgi:hypothetical protein